MAKHSLGREVLDFSAHAGSAFVALAIATALGSALSPLGGLAIAAALGFVREFTEWQDGGAHPFTPAGLLDQVGWIFGGAVFVLVASL